MCTKRKTFFEAVPRTNEPLPNFNPLFPKIKAKLVAASAEWSGLINIFILPVKQLCLSDVCVTWSHCHCFYVRRSHNYVPCTMPGPATYKLYSFYSNLSLLQPLLYSQGFWSWFKGWIDEHTERDLEQFSTGRGRLINTTCA